MTRGRLGRGPQELQSGGQDGVQRGTGRAWAHNRGAGEAGLRDCEDGVLSKPPVFIKGYRLHMLQTFLLVGALSSQHPLVGNVRSSCP